MGKRLFSILILSGMVLFSCTDSNNYSDIEQIEYGTSFGECIGYCKHTLILQKDLVSHMQSAWVDSLENIYCYEGSGLRNWYSFQDQIDIEAFFKMPQTIGCPDCADGGAEWVQIKLNDGKTHKTTFEYGNEPESLKSLVSELRLQMQETNKCEEFN